MHGQQNIKTLKLNSTLLLYEGLGSSVGIATDYEMVRPGSK